MDCWGQLWKLWKTEIMASKWVNWLVCLLWLREALLGREGFLLGRAARNLLWVPSLTYSPSCNLQVPLFCTKCQNLVITQSGEYTDPFPLIRVNQESGEVFVCGKVSKRVGQACIHTRKHTHRETALWWFASPGYELYWAGCWRSW